MRESFERFLAAPPPQNHVYITEMTPFKKKTCLILNGQKEKRGRSETERGCVVTEKRVRKVERERDREHNVSQK